MKRKGFALNAPLKSSFVIHKIKEVMPHPGHNLPVTMRKIHGIAIFVIFIQIKYAMPAIRIMQVFRNFLLITYFLRFD